HQYLLINALTFAGSITASAKAALNRSNASSSYVMTRLSVAVANDDVRSQMFIFVRRQICLLNIQMFKPHTPEATVAYSLYTS
ncbi:hypothetical protein BD769DRAFT_591310, partial [Suillus cothurnatus]